MFVSRLIPTMLLVRLFVSEAQAKTFTIFTPVEPEIYPSQVLYPCSTPRSFESRLDLHCCDEAALWPRRRSLVEIKGAVTFVAMHPFSIIQLIEKVEAQKQQTT